MDYIHKSEYDFPYKLNFLTFRFAVNLPYHPFWRENDLMKRSLKRKIYNKQIYKQLVPFGRKT